MYRKFKHLNIPDGWEQYWSKYPNGYTIMEALIDWVSQVDDMVTNQNELTDTVKSFGERIDDFINQFGDNLANEVQDLLTEWQTSGFLDVVISEALQWQLDDYIATNEQDKLSLTAQLAQIEISVKDFGAIGNANYFNEYDKSWYEDSAFTIPAHDDTLNFHNAYIHPATKRTIRVPDGNYLINPADRTKTALLSNTHLIFSDKAKFVFKQTNRDIYAGLFLNDVENIVIDNIAIEGDRYYNTKTTEGAGNGITLLGVKNLKLTGRLDKCFTDGLYVNTVENAEINVTCDDNRRQGMSLTSGNKILFENCEFSNTNGTAPEMGVDIEPNYATDELKDIVFRNCKSSGNNNAGLGINLNGLDTDNLVGITVENWVDDGSLIGLYITKSRGSVNENSSIIISDFKSLNAKECGIDMAGYKSVGSPHVQLIRPIVYNPNVSGGTNQRHQDVGISINSDISGYPAGVKQGNISLIEPSVVVADGRTILRGIYVGYGEASENIKIIDPVKLKIGSEETISLNNNHVEISLYDYVENIIITDRYRTLERSFNGSIVRNLNQGFYSRINIKTPNGTVVINEITRWQHVNKIRFTKSVGTATSIQVNIPLGFIFLKDGVQITGSITSNSLNACLEVEEIVDGVYNVKVINGTWTVQ